MTVAIRVCFIKILTYSIIRCIYAKLGFWPLLQTIIRSDCQAFVIVICKSDAKSIRKFQRSIQVIAISRTNLCRYCIIIIQFMFRRKNSPDCHWMLLIKIQCILCTKIQFIVWNRYPHLLYIRVRLRCRGINDSPRPCYISPKIRSIHTQRKILKYFHTNTTIKLMQSPISCKTPGLTDSIINFAIRHWISHIGERQ